MIKRKLRLKFRAGSHESVGLQRGLTARCFACGLEVELVTEAQAVRILNATGRQLLDAGRVHALQTENGNIWVSKDSLFRQP